MDSGQRSWAIRTGLRLLPLILIYIIAVSVYSAGHPNLRVDENRYAAFATRLTEGYYSTPGRLSLWNGPGYPLVLTPFAALNAPWVAARFLNVLFMFLGFMYLFRAIRMYAPAAAAYAGVYVFGLMPVVIEHVPRMLTEPLCVFLVCGFAYHFLRMYRHDENRRRHLLAAAAYLGYVALTKVLFGYVIGAAIVIFLAASVATRHRVVMRSLAVACLALVVCIPYLTYTYSLTGRAFYWARSGGLSLYWMSTPFEEEYGDWQAAVKPWARNPEKGKNHADFLNEVAKRDQLEQDDMLKRAAWENIRNHPGKYARNWVANVGRLFCNFPFSYRTQGLGNYWNIIPGVLLGTLLVVTLFLAWTERRRITYEMVALGAFALLYIGGSSLLSAYNRMLIPVMPILAVWICYVLADLARNKPSWFGLRGS